MFEKITRHITRPLFFAILLWFLLSISFGITEGEATTSLFLVGYLISELIIALSTVDVASSSGQYFVIFLGTSINFLIYFFIGLLIEKTIKTKK